MNRLVPVLMLGIGGTGLAGAAAGDTVAERLRACLDAAADRAAEYACRGVEASMCMQASADGSTTAGMATCIGKEAEAWEALVEEALTRIAEAAGDTAATPAQSAWEAFRAADCDTAARLWGEGSMAGIAAADCWLDRTASRAMELRARLSALEMR